MAMADRSSTHRVPSRDGHPQEGPRLAPFLPLLPLQLVLARTMAHILRQRPGLFHRLGPHQHTRFLIDPVNLPLALLLVPDPDRPVLRAVNRREPVPHDARIAGSALTLLDMVDGRFDGDALFFTRDLQVTGDTEAVVSLRNTLDDLDGSVADDAASMAGPAGRMILWFLRRLRRRQPGADAS